MSILVWRMWYVNYIEYTVKLSGFYGESWVPGEVMQAKCDYMHFMYPREFKLNSLNTLFKPFLHVRTESYDMLFKPFLHVREKAPAVTCTCGIYGLNHIPSPYPAFYYVGGIAEIWGKIIVAEEGYRAQYARIRALVNAPGPANIYGVPNLPTIEYARREFFA